MWCAAALSSCGIAVRADGARCTPMRHGDRARVASTCALAAIARCAAPRPGRVVAPVGPDIAEPSSHRQRRRWAVPANPARPSPRALQDNGVPPCTARPDAGAFRPPAAAEQQRDIRPPQRCDAAQEHDMTTGKVTLLGAGPGDPDLLTLKAVKALAAADVLLLDDLVAPGIVELAPRARVIRVGKRGGCRSTPQAFIEKLMRRYALRGAHVVRVKGGDALLFGRAGEELATLRAAAIPVEIVNGISSGFAAAASLGISLTHREHCQGVTFVTAHRQDHGEPDWARLAATGTTLAIYMGMSRVDSIAAGLLAALPASTPAAAVQWAGTPDERRWTGTLGTLACGIEAERLGSPAVILVGGAIGAAAAQGASTATGAALARAA
ncbi:Uroporphyrin-III C/tetrapyrrole (Corrin/Porphyrin) methyltransferase [Burkholderia cenocepacia PC184]|nr:Uroporphyrin-III C/tetrapyrrole (Corrin/Porphyrin) methyltransferase [Burkholderia cenocepacia PC184]